MGTWGVEILSNDLALDVYNEFMKLYDKGFSLNDIRKKLENSYKTLDEEESHIFILAVAKAQWECQALDKDILSQVEHMVHKGIGLELWSEISFYNDRVKALNEFLEKIKISTLIPRKRRKIKFIKAPYEPGECLTFKLLDGKYGGAFVLGKDSSAKEEELNIIASLDLHSQNKPSIDQFLNAGVLNRKAVKLIEKNTYENIIVNCSAIAHKKEGDKFEVVSIIEDIKREFNLSKSYSTWNYLIDIPNRYLFKRSENQYLINPQITVKQLLNQDKGIIKK